VQAKTRANFDLLWTKFGMLPIVNMCYYTGVYVEISGYCLFFMMIIKNCWVNWGIIGQCIGKIFMECDSINFYTVYMMQDCVCSKLVSSPYIFILHLRRWEKFKSDVKLAELSIHINTWWIRL